MLLVWLIIETYRLIQLKYSLFVIYKVQHFITLCIWIHVHIHVALLNRGVGLYIYLGGCGVLDLILL